MQIDMQVSEAYANDLVRQFAKFSISPLLAPQNGIIERFFRSLKEECVWQHRFATFTEARHTVGQWIQWYNEGRPHQALAYRSPRQYRLAQSAQVAS